MEKPRPLTEQLSASIPTDMYQISGHGKIDIGRYLRNKDQDELIKKVVPGKRTSLDNIRLAPEQERAPLIRDALSKEDIEVQRVVVWMIMDVPEQEQTSLRALVSEKIRDALSQEDIDVQRLAVGMIHHVPISERALFIRDALSKEDIGVQRVAAGTIMDAPKQEQTSLRLLVSEKIKEVLSKEDIEVQRVAVGMIMDAPVQERALLIKEALSKEDIEVQRVVTEMIVYAPEQEQTSLRLLVSEKIKEALSKEDIEVQRVAVGMIIDAPVQERAPLMKIAFNAGLGDEIIKPPLYDNSDLDQERYQRKKFAKTGSGTTLVGGALRDKLIIRHIKPEAFLT
jgi:hypothetical protein